MEKWLQKSHILHAFLNCCCIPKRACSDNPAGVSQGKKSRVKSLVLKLLLCVKKIKKLTKAFPTWPPSGAEEVRVFEYPSIPLSYWSRSKSSALLYVYSHGCSAFIYLDCSLTYCWHWEPIINNTADINTSKGVCAQMRQCKHTHCVMTNTNGASDKVWIRELEDA